MLPSSLRLDLRKHYQFFNTAQKKHGQDVIFFLNRVTKELNKTNQEENQQLSVAIIVPRKKVTSAVQRNRYKRIMRRSVSNVAAKLDVTTNSTLQIVVFLKRNVRNIQVEDFSSRLEKELIEVIKENSIHTQR